MNAFLAQLSSANPEHVKDFAIIVLAIASPILAVVGLVVGGRRKIEPDPLRVQKVDGLVSHDDFARHVEVNEQAHRDLFSKLGGQERGLRSESKQELAAFRSEVKEDLRGIHNRINQILEVVSTLKGKVSS